MNKLILIVMFTFMSYSALAGCCRYNAQGQLTLHNAATLLQNPSAVAPGFWSLTQAQCLSHANSTPPTPTGPAYRFITSNNPLACKGADPDINACEKYPGSTFMQLACPSGMVQAPGSPVVGLGNEKWGCCMKRDSGSDGDGKDDPRKRRRRR